MMSKFALAFVLATAAAGTASAQTADLQVGQAFGAWVFQCNAVGQDKTLCAFSATAVGPDKKRVIVDLRISRPAADAPFMMSALLPLGLNIQTGVKTAVDGAEPVDLPLRACFAKGCVASAELDDATLDALKSGTSLLLQFDIAGKTVSADMKLEGLNDALTAANW
jgi:invasion protein IalB